MSTRQWSYVCSLPAFRYWEGEKRENVINGQRALFQSFALFDSPVSESPLDVSELVGVAAQLVIFSAPITEGLTLYQIDLFPDIKH